MLDNTVYNRENMELNAVSITIIVLLIVIAYLFGRLQNKKPVQTDIPQDFIDLYKQVNNLPLRILQTIQGSINPQKGKMAELLTYAELRYDYDRIIPLGWPIDFIGIKNNDRIDFIEVKSGSAAVLTEEEKHIKTLIGQGRVSFRLIKVTENEVNQFIESSTRAREKN